MFNNIKSFLGIGNSSQPVPSAEGEFYPLTNTNYGVKNFTRTDYMNLYTSRVFMCTTTIANTITGLEHHLLTKKDSKNIINHEFYDMLNPDILDCIVSQYLITGNAFIYKIMLDNKLLGLEVLRSDNVYIHTDYNGDLKHYEYNNGGYNLKIEKHEMINIGHFSPFNSLGSFQKGISQVSAVAMQMETDVTANRYNWNFFKNGASARDVLSTDKQLTQESKERLIRKWRNEFQGVNNSNKVALLDNNLKYSTHSPSQKELDFVESRRFTRDEVLAIFKIPKAVVGITDDVNRASAQVAQEIYMRNCINPIVKKIEYHLNKGLFNGLGYFEFIDVIPSDTEQLHKDLLVGAITVDEYRLAMGYKQSDKVKRQETDDKKLKKKMINIIRKNTEGTAERYADLEAKGNEKRKKKIIRMDSYEIDYREAVIKVRQQQESEIMQSIQKKYNRKKSIRTKDMKNDVSSVLDKIKWSVVWYNSLKIVNEDIMLSEGTNALLEVGLVNQMFNIGSPKTQKYIRDNINKLGKELDDTTKKIIFKIIEDGEKEGLGEQEVLNRISSRFEDMKRSRVQAIVRTEVTRSANKADIIARQESGIVTRKRRVSELDNRTSNICESLHGTIIELNDDFAKVGDTIGKETITYENVQHPPAHVNCYDKETEVYTDKGRLKFNQLHGEKIFSLNPDTLVPEFVDYVNYYEYISDTIVEYKGNRFDLATTENHNQFVKFRKKQKGRNDHSMRKLVTDNELPKNDFNFLKGNNWIGKKTGNKIKIGDKEYDTKAFVAFMGRYLSEGSTTKKSKNSYVIKIAQEKEGGVEKIVRYIDKINDDIKIWKGGVYFNDNNLSKYLLQFGHSHEKYVPKIIKEMDKEHIQLFLDCYLAGDGHIRKGKIWKGYKFNDSRSYFTSSDKMAGDIGELILKIGKSVSYIKKNVKGTEQKFKNGTYTINNDLWCIYELKNTEVNRNNLSREVKQYNDYVYDVELEKYHVLLVRRNGKICWSGNCRSALIAIMD